MENGQPQSGDVSTWFDLRARREEERVRTQLEDAMQEKAKAAGSQL
jgi:hypothetical protein